MIKVGNLLSLAHWEQRAPTGVCTIHLGQIGFPHLLQVRPVITFGWVAQRISVISGFPVLFIVSKFSTIYENR